MPTENQEIQAVNAASTLIEDLTLPTALRLKAMDLLNALVGCPGSGASGLATEDDLRDFMDVDCGMLEGAVPINKELDRLIEDLADEKEPCCPDCHEKENCSC